MSLRPCPSCHGSHGAAANLSLPPGLGAAHALGSPGHHHPSEMSQPRTPEGIHVPWDPSWGAPGQTPGSLEDVVSVCQQPGLSLARTLQRLMPPRCPGVMFLDLLGAALLLGFPLPTHFQSPYRCFQNLLPKSFLQGAYQDLHLRSSDSGPWTRVLGQHCHLCGAGPHSLPSTGAPTDGLNQGSEPATSLRVQIPASGSEGRPLGLRSRHMPAFYEREMDGRCSRNVLWDSGTAAPSCPASRHPPGIQTGEWPFC